MYSIIGHVAKAHLQIPIIKILDWVEAYKIWTLELAQDTESAETWKDASVAQTQV